MTNAAGLRESRESLAKNSKSFALAGKLLPPGTRDDAAVIYAWCRRADDAVDLVPQDQQAAALTLLRQELVDIYRGQRQSDPVLAAFQEVVTRRRIPETYPGELLAGMEMDVAQTVYATLDELLLYCFRVAGTVGLMMSHVMGVTDPRSLRQAAHLGIGMQLTNICRDVDEDWNRGRLYVPQELISTRAPQPIFGSRLPRALDPALRSAVAQLLGLATRYYRSGDSGLPALSFRCAAAIRAARLIYAAIGTVIERRDCDVWAGRAVVPTRTKLWLALRAFAGTAFARSIRWTVAFLAAAARFSRIPARPLLIPTLVVRFPDDIALG